MNYILGKCKGFGKISGQLWKAEVIVINQSSLWFGSSGTGNLGTSERRGHNKMDTPEIDTIAEEVKTFKELVEQKNQNRGINRYFSMLFSKKTDRIFQSN